MSHRRNSIFDSIAMLALIGILAGAIGGLGIGMMSKAATGSSSTSSTTH
jgi:hypothetical protein